MKQLFIFGIIFGLVFFNGCASKKFNDVQKIDTVTAYDNFLKEYPKHDLAQEAKRLREKAFFNEAVKDGSVNKLNQYLKEYTNGQYILAMEPFLWKAAMKEKSIASFEQYLQTYPKGEFSNKANTMLEQLYFEKANSDNTVSSLRDFISRYPNNEFIQTFKDRIGILEKSEWETTMSVDTVAGYKSFLENFPETKQRGAIEGKIKKRMKDASCIDKKAIFYEIKPVLTENLLADLIKSHKSCIEASAYCQICGNPSIGRCSMRNILVCEEHRIFTQNGLKIRCPH